MNQEVIIGRVSYVTRWGLVLFARESGCVKTHKKALNSRLETIVLPKELVKQKKVKNKESEQIFQLAMSFFSAKYSKFYKNSEQGSR